MPTPMTVYVQDASTAKLFVMPSHGSPKVFVETPMLQLFDPMQACTTSLLLSNATDNTHRGRDAVT